MYCYSYLSPKCEIHKSLLQGRGIFAKKTIQENELIAIWGGKIYSKAELQKIGKKHHRMMTHPIEIYKGFFLGPINPRRLDPTDLFNHSCNPNSGIRGQIVLVAKRKIEMGQEITYDYETSDTSLIGQPLICKCNSENCRKIIKGTAWKKKSFQNNNRKFLSFYIYDLIKNNPS